MDNQSTLAKAASWLKGLFPSQEATPEPVLPPIEYKPRKQPSFTPTMGRITSYNYKGDKYGDTNSKKGIGAWDNKLTKDSLAVSPDIEKQFIAAGIKPMQPVTLTLADGTKITRYWDDRTMQDKQAKRELGQPLRGRFDFNMNRADSPHEKDSVEVVAFAPFTTPEIQPLGAQEIIAMPSLAKTVPVPSPQFPQPLIAGD